MDIFLDGNPVLCNRSERTRVDTEVATNEDQSTHEASEDETTGRGAEHAGRDHKSNLFQIVGRWVNNHSQSKRKQSCYRSDCQTLQLQQCQVSFDEGVPGWRRIQQSHIALQSIDRKLGKNVRNNVGANGPRMNMIIYVEKCLNEQLTAVERRLARFISKFPLRLSRMGIKIMSSEISRKTGQCYKKNISITWGCVGWVTSERRGRTKKKKR